ncbi:hypothetical protein Dimus_023350 [Dionaea muscipula]
MACDDEIYEIFAWLPAATLFKFATVSTSCNNYMSNPLFQELQSRRSIWRTAGVDGYFIYPDRSFASGESLQLIGTSLPHSFMDFLAWRGSATGKPITSSNGLVLCRKPSRHSDLIIFNPAARKALTICGPGPFEETPNPEPSISNPPECRYEALFGCGSGRDGSDATSFAFANDYQLIALASVTEIGIDGRWSTKFHSKAYSPSRRVWEDNMTVFDDCKRTLRLNNPAFLVEQGTVYYLTDSSPKATSWPVYTRPNIMVLDFNQRSDADDQNKESIKPRVLKLPGDAWRRRDDGSRGMRIFKWRRSWSWSWQGGGDRTSTICLVRLRQWQFTIWILEDLERSCSWRRILKLRVCGINRLLKKEDEERITGYVVTEGGNLVFATIDKVYEIGLREEDDDDFGKIKYMCDHHVDQNCQNILIMPHCSTLRPCS